MEHYKEIMERVRCVVEERIWVTMTTTFSDAGVEISLYCAEYDFEFATHIYYRDIETDNRPVLYTANKIVADFEQELVRNIERK